MLILTLTHKYNDIGLLTLPHSTIHTHTMEHLHTHLEIHLNIHILHIHSSFAALHIQHEPRTKYLLTNVDNRCFPVLQQ